MYLCQISEKVQNVKVVSISESGHVCVCMCMCHEVTRYLFEYEYRYNWVIKIMVGKYITLGIMSSDVIL